jgi:hypothetical protein
MRRAAPLARGSSQLKRTGFKAPVRAQKARTKTAAATLTPVPSGSRSPSVMAKLIDEVRAAPKTVELRNPSLLAMARGRLCLLRVPGTCSYDPQTTVACHSNQAAHGKGGARKADDHYSVWGCHACHTWLDQEAVGYEVRTDRFAAALVIQIEQWLTIASSLTEPESHRRAARWALFQHGVPV